MKITVTIVAIGLVCAACTTSVPGSTQLTRNGEGCALKAADPTPSGWRYTSGYSFKKTPADYSKANCVANADNARHRNRVLDQYSKGVPLESSENRAGAEGGGR